MSIKRLNYNGLNSRAYALSRESAIDGRHRELFSPYSLKKKNQGKGKYHIERPELEKCVAEYLANDGKITRLPPSGVGKNEQMTVRSSGAMASGWARGL